MKTIIANPNDKEHIKLFKEYNKELDLDYLNQKQPREVKEILFNTKDNKLNNISYIYGYNDIKNCHIYFENYDFKNTSFLNEVIEYTEKSLDMQSICFHIPRENNNLERLEKLGFEFLGVLDNEDTVIMEKYKDEELIKESKRR